MHVAQTGKQLASTSSPSCAWNSDWKKLNNTIEVTLLQLLVLRSINIHSVEQLYEKCADCVEVSSWVMSLRI